MLVEPQQVEATAMTARGGFQFGGLHGFTQIRARAERSGSGTANGWHQAEGHLAAPWSLSLGDEQNLAEKTGLLGSHIRILG